MGDYHSRFPGPGFRKLVGDPGIELSSSLAVALCPLVTSAPSLQGGPALALDAASPATVVSNHPLICSPLHFLSPMQSLMQKRSEKNKFAAKTNCTHLRKCFYQYLGHLFNYFFNVCAVVYVPFC